MRRQAVFVPMTPLHMSVNGAVDNVRDMTASARRAGTGIVVYDLDGVITTKDSFSALIIQRLRTAPLRVLRSLPAAVTMLLCSQEDRKRRAARRVAEIALTGVGEREYSAYALAFGKRIGADPAWIRAAVVRRIRQQHDSGACVIIATATERRLAQALLASAGVPHDGLSARWAFCIAAGRRSIGDDVRRPPRRSAEDSGASRTTDCHRRRRVRDRLDGRSPHRSGGSAGGPHRSLAPNARTLRQSGDRNNTANEVTSARRKTEPAAPCVE